MPTSTRPTYCVRCGKELPMNASFCPSCGQPGSVSCYLHPTTPAAGSCSKCGKPTCNICLVTKSGFLSGPSQVCPLCIRYENSLNWSAGVALVAFIVLGVVTFNLLVASATGLVLFGLILTESRKRARRELGVR